MAKVTYVQADGSSITCEVSAGDSVMDGALDNGVPGIIGRCGGGCTCATCHCYVREPFLQQLPDPHPDEAEMLEYIGSRRTNSRLSCQIRVEERLDGITVEVPLHQD